MITLTSDFGLKDPYVAEMKGVILTINSKSTIVDITHDIEKFNIRMAGFHAWLQQHHIFPKAPFI